MHPSVIHDERTPCWRESMTHLFSGSRNAVLVAKSHSHFGPTDRADGNRAGRSCEIARPTKLRQLGMRSIRPGLYLVL